ncbi:MAG: Ig domain-containing protein [Acidobacteriota bacterium]
MDAWLWRIRARVISYFLARYPHAESAPSPPEGEVLAPSPTHRGPRRRRDISPLLGYASPAGLASEPDGSAEQIARHVAALALAIFLGLCIFAGYCVLAPAARVTAPALSARSPRPPVPIPEKHVVALLQGEPVEIPLGAVGGIPPFTFAALEELPQGLHLSDTGVLLGKPEKPEAAVIPVWIRDAASASQRSDVRLRVFCDDLDRNLFLVTLNSAPAFSAIDLSTYGPPPATLGRAYACQLRWPDGERGRFQVDERALPGGLTLDEDGLLWGTPTQAGSFAVTVTLLDGQTEARLQTWIIVSPLEEVRSR